MFSVLFPLITPDTNEQKLTAIYQQLTHTRKLKFFIQLLKAPLDKKHGFKDSIRKVLISFKGLWIAITSMEYLCMQIFQFFYVKFNTAIYKSLNTLKAEILLGSKNYCHNSLSRSCCNLIWFSLLKSPWCHLQWVKPIGQLQNYRYSSPKDQDQVPQSFKGTLFPIFNKIIQHELPVIADQQLKDTFSIVWITLHTWLNFLDLRANDINSGTNNFSCKTSVYLKFPLNYINIEISDAGH